MERELISPSENLPFLPIGDSKGEIKFFKLKCSSLDDTEAADGG